MLEESEPFRARVLEEERGGGGNLSEAFTVSQWANQTMQPPNPTGIGIDAGPSSNSHFSAPLFQAPSSRKHQPSQPIAAVLVSRFAPPPVLIDQLTVSVHQTKVSPVLRRIHRRACSATP
jgi:hypothetical protein